MPNQVLVLAEAVKASGLVKPGGDQARGPPRAPAPGRGRSTSSAWSCRRSARSWGCRACCAGTAAAGDVRAQVPLRGSLSSAHSAWKSAKLLRSPVMPLASSRSLAAVEDAGGHRAARRRQAVDPAVEAADVPAVGRDVREVRVVEDRVAGEVVGEVERLRRHQLGRAGEVRRGAGEEHVRQRVAGHRRRVLHPEVGLRDELDLQRAAQLGVQVGPDGVAVDRRARSPRTSR